MRSVILLSMLLLAGPADAEAPPADFPAPPGPRATNTGPSPELCRDRIEQVREETGQPKLEREAWDEEPLLIAAVDKRIDGCSVLVMRNDLSDVRPIPRPGNRTTLRPAQ
jgi:hypothetical protein